jgi:hypothetical protein
VATTTSIGAGAPAASNWRRLRDLLSPRSTPGGFRLGAVVATAICAICGILGAGAIAARDGSLDSAETAAQQLVGVQEVRIAAVQADSIAASSYLDPERQAESRQAYEQSLADATQGLVAVAGRAPQADQESLQQANNSLATFSGLVEQSRANNLQGFPVGAAYQRQASLVLDEGVLTPLDQVAIANRERLNSSLSDSTRNGAIAIALLGVALVSLVVVSWLIFRRTRRLVNVPIAVGGALLILAFAWSAVILALTGRTIDDTVGTSLRGTDALAQARSSAFDARSAEALTLIYRGNGARFEAQWQLADAEILAALDDACATAGDCFAEPWQAYRDVHVEVRGLDDGGEYDAAVDLALGDTGQRFAEFAEQTAETQSARAAEVTAGFDDARGPLGLLRWVVLAAGLGAAATVVIGYGQRLREYR